MYSRSKTEIFEAVATKPTIAFSRVSSNEKKSQRNRSEDFKSMLASFIQLFSMLDVSLKRIGKYLTNRKIRRRR